MARMKTARAAAGSNRPEERRKVVATNRKAKFDYTILDVFEAGIALQGTEVKSLRAGHVSLNDAFATVTDGEIWLRGLHIQEYDFGSWTNHEPRRARKLLLHRDEIRRLAQLTNAKGMTVVPLRLVLRRGRAKVDLGVARGKKLYDKRESLAAREAQRDIERAIRGR